MIFIAGAFGTFVLFLFLGLLALPVTAALDKGLGKEKALLLYSGILLVFTFFVLTPSGPSKKKAKAPAEKTVPAVQLVRSGDPFKRAEPNHEAERNPFKPFSDTQPLPPIALEQPPWIPLDFTLPPPIPGPAPGYRHTLRGELPALSAGDGSAIAEIPDALFVDYAVKPEDVYDWVITGGKAFYIYIRAINDGRRWHEEDDPTFEALKWKLTDADSEGYGDLQVRAAYIGAESQAAKHLDPLAVLKQKRKGLTDKRASDQEGGWYLRRTVDNLFVETLRANGIRVDYAKGPIDPSALRRAAKTMAEIGETGKEGRKGWRKAVELLEAALAKVRETQGPSVVSEYLLQVLEAHRALRDEQAELRVLAEYIQTAPNSADAPTWLGDLHLRGMQLPTEALAYYEAALGKNSRHGAALIGRGDALSYIGQHTGALSSYNRASSDIAGQLRRAEAELRLGKLDAARGSAESILSRDPGAAAALLIRACALYVKGDLDTARGAFEQLASAPSDPATNRLRGQACYNLGLTCLRQGQRDAALAAFDACEKALKQGASTGPTPDETVSPSLGRALVAFAEKNENDMLKHLDRARNEAPRSSYGAMFAGMVASLAGNDSSAVRALDMALREAPGFAELDGWLGRTYLLLGQRELETGASAQDTAETFERAIAFSQRAADNDTRRSKTKFSARLRECLVRIGAGHLPKKQRYAGALAAAEKVLAVGALREQPAALALAGYCNYQLANYDECIRKFQQVLDVVQDEDEAEWKSWRDYAEKALTAVKHWRSLEEKIVTFKSTNLDRQWGQEEGNGVTIIVEPEEGRVTFKGDANKDGRLEDPIVTLTNRELYKRETFEQISLSLRIPRSNRRGEAVNNITFGVQVSASARRGGRQRAKTPGIGIFYDKAKVAVRIGGGQMKKYKEGNIIRLDPEQAWPGDEVRIRIVREDAKKGTMAVFINDELVIRDNISGFKQSRGLASLWIGGYSTETEPFDVSVGDIRVIRRKSTGRK